jgi:hypothetical protein
VVYEVPAAKRSLKQNLFEFKVGQKTYTVPKFAYLPVGVLEALADAGDDALGPFLDAFGAKDTAVGKAVRGLEQEQLIGLIKAWQADSDVTVGESEAS